MGTGAFLVTPVVRDASAKGLSAISAEIASFEDSLFSENGETRDAALSDESKIATGTFSIHNLGEIWPSLLSCLFVTAVALL